MVFKRIGALYKYKLFLNVNANVRLIALPLEDLERGNAQVNWQEAGNRRVERGSRLVTAVAQAGFKE